MKKSSWLQIQGLFRKLSLNDSYEWGYHQVGLINFASVILGVIRHNGRVNVHLFSEKKAASIICTYGQFCSPNFSLTDHAPNIFGQTAGSWVPQKLTKTDPLTGLNACAYLARLPKMAFCVLVVLKLPPPPSQKKSQFNHCLTVLLFQWFT